MEETTRVRGLGIEEKMILDLLGLEGGLVPKNQFHYSINPKSKIGTVNVQNPE
ncbi:MAG: hypothetical protein HWQ23_23330 [Nostoc sp. JL33]|uniref:hypothetical protein n=1 Tax=Nostoc sp. JL33 TaxID=2815396 RepID=UPI0025CBFE64|nr:hypothetical protein [Nostoc sp. JL33]MBN3873096.1 hypothetical protein [Nostoc sp. JL33]